MTLLLVLLALCLVTWVWLFVAAAQHDRLAGNRVPLSPMNALGRRARTPHSWAGRRPTSVTAPSA